MFVKGHALSQERQGCVPAANEELQVWRYVGKKNKKKCLTSLGRCARASRLQQYPWNEIFHKIGPTYCIPAENSSNYKSLIRTIR